MTLRRTLLIVGLLAFAVNTFLPAYAFREGAPYDTDGNRIESERVILFGSPGPMRMPAAELIASVQDLSHGFSPREAMWSRRAVYTHAFLPVWLIALLIAWRRPKTANVLLWLVTLAVAVLEAFYLNSDYKSFLPGWAGRAESALSWGGVVAVLLYRPRRHRRWDAYQATIGAQALLALMHAATLPASVLRDWYGTFGTEAISGRVLEQFEPGFWIGCAGLLLIVLWGYSARSRAPVPVESIRGA